MTRSALDRAGLPDESASTAPAAPDAASFDALGVLVGHADDADGATGLTVVRGARAPLVAAVAAVGRATATRELHALDPEHLVGRADAVLLTGGSAYGLDAAAGVMRWCEERGRGFDVGGGVVPIVPAAAVFDLLPLGRFDARPTAAMAYAACEAAAFISAEGSVGAGAGATVGKSLGSTRAMKGGVGCAVESADDGAAAGAVVVVNAFGDVRAGGGAIIAGALAAERRFAAAASALARGPAVSSFAAAAGRNTTLALVCTTAPLSRVQLAQLARAATAALYRRITPVGTSFDGDVVFAVRPAAAPYGEPPREGDDAGVGHATLLQIETLAVRALERAIERAVRLAVGRDGVPGLADLPDVARS